MKSIYFILWIGIALSSCSNSDVMDRTIFIPDVTDAKLPAYTEWGYNSFGAEYERGYFLVSNQIVPCKILYHNNQLQFLLSGITNNYNNMTLSFIFPYPQMSDYKGLIQLNNVKIDITANNCMVKMLLDGSETILTVLDGELYFKRAQLLSIDDNVNRVILSGIFDLRFLQNGIPSTISNGRFDVGITKNVFYSY